MDEILATFELANDVVPLRENESIGLIIVTTNQFIVTIATIKSVGTISTMQNIVATVAMELVVFLKAEDEVIGSRSIKVGIAGI